MEGDFKIALFATKGSGKRARQHRVVIYIAIDKDWSSIQLQRNGNTGRPLAVAPSTPECAAYRSASKRARSLQYSGVGRANLRGLAEDLETLGFSQAVVSQFSDAAKPYLEVSK